MREFASNRGPVGVVYDAETDVLCVFLRPPGLTTRDVPARQSAAACLLRDIDTGELIGVQIYGYSCYDSSVILIPEIGNLTLPPFETLHTS